MKKKYQIILKYSVCSFLFSTLALSCSKEQKEKTTKVSFVLPKAIKFKTTSTNSDKINQKNVPTQMSEVNCYALIVGGPDTELKRSQCPIYAYDSSSNNTKTVSRKTQVGTKYFGRLVGLAAPETKIEVSVPPGSDRVFTLLGFQTNDSQTCYNFNSEEFINTEDYTSAPVILGETGKVNLLPDSDNIVKITIPKSETEFSSTLNTMFDDGCSGVDIPQEKLQLKMVLEKNNFPNEYLVQKKCNPLTVKFINSSGKQETLSKPITLQLKGYDSANTSKFLNISSTIPYTACNAYSSKSYQTMIVPAGVSEYSFWVGAPIENSSYANVKVYSENMKSTYQYSDSLTLESVSEFTANFHIAGQNELFLSGYEYTLPVELKNNGGQSTNVSGLTYTATIAESSGNSIFYDNPNYENNSTFENPASDLFFKLNQSIKSDSTIALNSISSISSFSGSASIDTTSPPTDIFGFLFDSTRNYLTTAYTPTLKTPNLKLNFQSDSYSTVTTNKTLGGFKLTGPKLHEPFSGHHCIGPFEIKAYNSEKTTLIPLTSTYSQINSYSIKINNLANTNLKLTDYCFQPHIYESTSTLYRVIPTGNNNSFLDNSPILRFYIYNDSTQSIDPNSQIQLTLNVKGTSAFNSNDTKTEDLTFTTDIR